MSEVTSNSLPVSSHSHRAICAKPSPNSVQLTLENTLNITKKKKKKKKEDSGWFSSRHYLTMMLFFGVANYFVVRDYVSSSIGAMVNQTADVNDQTDPSIQQCPDLFNSGTIEYWGSQNSQAGGKFIWNNFTKYCSTYIFFVGFVLFQIPSSLIALRYGSARLLGWGSLISSALGLIIPIVTEVGGGTGLIVVRAFQGIFMSPVLTCSIDLISKWIPPNERSRCVAFVNSAGHFGLTTTYLFSGYATDSSLGWPCIFYFFGSVTTLWCLFLIYTVYEDPDSNPKIDPAERKLINKLIRGNRRKSTSSSDSRKISSIPFRKIFTSWSFYAALVTEICCITGFFSILTLLPKYFCNISTFKKKEANVMTWVPLLFMWIVVILTGWTADHYLSKGFTRTRIRKFAVAIGSFGPGIFTLLSSYSICLTGFNIAMLTISLSLTGVIYTSASVNHLEKAPKYAGFLIAVTYSVGIVAGVGLTCFWGYLGALQSQRGWMITFVSLSTIYFATGMFFTLCGSGELQQWGEDNDQIPSIEATARIETIS